MLGKLRNMTSVYLTRGSKILLLYREGSRVANHVWIGSACLADILSPRIKTMPVPVSCGNCTKRWE